MVQLALEPPAVAAPGFVNFRLDDGWLATAVARNAESIALGPAPAREHVLVDFSSPNVAKEMPTAVASSRAPSTRAATGARRSRVSTAV